MPAALVYTLVLDLSAAQDKSQPSTTPAVVGGLVSGEIGCRIVATEGEGLGLSSADLPPSPALAFLHLELEDGEIAEESTDERTEVVETWDSPGKATRVRFSGLDLTSAPPLRTGDENHTEVSNRSNAIPNQISHENIGLC